MSKLFTKKSVPQISEMFRTVRHVRLIEIVMTESIWGSGESIPLPEAVGIPADTKVMILDFVPRSKVATTTQGGYYVKVLVFNQDKTVQILYWPIPTSNSERDWKPDALFSLSWYLTFEMMV